MSKVDCNVMLSEIISLVGIENLDQHRRADIKRIFELSLEPNRDDTQLIHELLYLTRILDLDPKRIGGMGVSPVSSNDQSAYRLPKTLTMVDVNNWRAFISEIANAHDRVKNILFESTTISQADYTQGTTDLAKTFDACVKTNLRYESVFVFLARILSFVCVYKRICSKYGKSSETESKLADVTRTLLLTIYNKTCNRYTTSRGCLDMFVTRIRFDSDQELDTAILFDMEFDFHNIELYKVHDVVEWLCRIIDAFMKSPETETHSIRRVVALVSGELREIIVS